MKILNFIAQPPKKSFLKKVDDLDERLDQTLSAEGSVERMPLETEPNYAGKRAEATRLLVEGAIQDLRNTPIRDMPYWDPKIAYKLGDPSGAWPENECQWTARGPSFALNLYFRSKAPFLQFLRERSHMPVELLDPSQFPYSQVDSAILQATLNPTIDNIFNANVGDDTVSLVALQMLDASVNGISGQEISQQTRGAQTRPITGIFDQVLNDLNETEARQFPKMEKEEKWKQTLKAIILRQKRFRGMKSQQVKQLEQARGEVQANIQSALLIRYRQVERYQRKIDEFWKKIDSAGDDTAKENFWRLVSYVSQNPDEFIEDPNGIFAGLDWQEISGCDDPIDFLDALRHTYLESIVQVKDRTANEAIPPEDLKETTNSFVDRVVKMQVSDRLNTAVEEEVGLIKVRKEQYDTALADAQFSSTYNRLNQMGVEMAAEEVPLAELVSQIQDALQFIITDVDLEAAIYPAGVIRLTAEEKFIYLINFFNDAPDALRLLDDPVKQQIKRQLFQSSETTLERFVSGGLTEEANPELRRQIIDSTMAVVESGAQVAASFEGLGGILKERDGAALQDFIQGINGLIAGYEQVQLILNAADEDGRSIREKLPQNEREAVENIILLEPLINDLKTIVTDLRAARNDFNTNFLSKVAQTDLAGSQAQQLDDYQKLLAQVTKDSKGGLPPGSRQGSGGLSSGEGGAIGVAGADIESTAETLGKDLQDIRKAVREWSETMSGIDGFTFDIPNISPGYAEIISGFQAALQTARRVGGLDNLNAPEEGAEDILDFDQRLKRDFARPLTQEMEAVFLEIFRKYSEQQFEILELMPEGFRVEDLKWVDLTHLGGDFNLTAGVTRGIQSLGAMRKTYNRSTDNAGGVEKSVFLENEDTIVRIISPDPASKNADIYVYTKKPEERGDLTDNKNYRVPLSKYQKAGSLVTYKAANESMPDALKPGADLPGQ